MDLRSGAESSALVPISLTGVGRVVRYYHRRYLPLRRQGRVSHAGGVS
jgi:hypothetical protein